MVLRAYPPSFRARYGSELAALTEELPDSARTTADLVRGALGAWIRPRFAGPQARRLRLQASVSTTWLAWCAGFLIVPAVNKALLDPPGSGTSALVRGLLHAGSALLFIGWLLALMGAAHIVVRALGPGLRSRPKFFLGPLVPVMVSGILLVLGLLALLAISHTAPSNPAGPWALIGWSCVLIGFLMCLGVGPGVSLRRLEVPAPTLRLPARLATGLALALAAMCACCLIAVAVAGDAALDSSSFPVVIVLVIASLASVVALVSSARGIRAARHT